MGGYISTWNSLRLVLQFSFVCLALCSTTFFTIHPFNLLLPFFWTFSHLRYIFYSYKWKKKILKQKKFHFQILLHNMQFHDSWWVTNTTTSSAFRVYEQLQSSINQVNILISLPYLVHYSLIWLIWQVNLECIYSIMLLNCAFTVHWLFYIYRRLTE